MPDGPAGGEAVSAATRLKVGSSFAPLLGGVVDPDRKIGAALSIPNFCAPVEFTETIVALAVGNNRAVCPIESGAETRRNRSLLVPVLLSAAAEATELKSVADVPAWKDVAAFW